MISLVLGQQDSGKSALAEEMAVKTGDEKRYYLATMKVYDETGRRRVLKHREKRAGKGFETIEKEYGVAQIAESIEDAKQSTLLLECVSNLVGNELFENPEWKKLARTDFSQLQDEDCEAFALAVMTQIQTLGQAFHHLICVSNTYASDDAMYDDPTRVYIKMLDLVNEKLQAVAEQVVDLRKNE